MEKKEVEKNSEKDIEKAEKNIKEINRRLGEIEKKAGKIDIPVPKGTIKKGVKKVIGILKKMVEEDTSEYREVGDKKIGNVRVQHGLKVRFLDEDKKKK